MAKAAHGRRAGGRNYNLHAKGPAGQRNHPIGRFGMRMSSHSGNMVSRRELVRNRMPPDVGPAGKTVTGGASEAGIHRTRWHDACHPDCNLFPKTSRSNCIPLTRNYRCDQAAHRDNAWRALAPLDPRGSSVIIHHPSRKQQLRSCTVTRQGARLIRKAPDIVSMPIAGWPGPTELAGLITPVVLSAHGDGSDWA